MVWGGDDYNANDEINKRINKVVEGAVGVRLVGEQVSGWQGIWFGFGDGDESFRYAGSGIGVGRSGWG